MKDIYLDEQGRPSAPGVTWPSFSSQPSCSGLALNIVRLLPPARTESAYPYTFNLSPNPPPSSTRQFTPANPRGEHL